MLKTRPIDFVDPYEERIQGIARFNFDMMCISAAMDKTESAGIDDSLEGEINKIYAKYPNKIRELERAYA